ncbi:hypothetical protein [Streptomyces aureus]|uniref:hypothetical protein n=1 Tax=Streptomyces aureus TaxID=193461 RepID=UPI0033E5BB64
MANEDGKQKESGRKPRKRWYEISLAYVGITVLGNAVLRFVFALFPLASNFSVGRLADALFGLFIQVVICCLFLGIFFYLRLKKRKESQN